MCAYPRKTICPPRSNDPFETGTAIVQRDFQSRNSGRYDHTRSLEAGTEQNFRLRGSEKRSKVTRRTFLQGLVAVPVVATTIGFPVPEKSIAAPIIEKAKLGISAERWDLWPPPYTRVTLELGEPPLGWPHGMYRREEKYQHVYPVDIAPSTGSSRSYQDAAACPNLWRERFAGAEWPRPASVPS
ncbi:hypothetical protein SAMN04488026_107817 [Aliiruegeria lutimaris]|uniref:Uncharacterized protein n=1 Tax=Aliiruegeria lutimaris TaxID=571298 RepID=A0A1G9J3V9_9RHOB|nr:hypothetical protein SAMN04488026_107817 [Aliiruegeria lutimaris]